MGIYRECIIIRITNSGFRPDWSVELWDNEISGHQQSWGYEDGPWKGPGPPLLVVADFLIFFLISVLADLLVLMTT